MEQVHNGYFAQDKKGIIKDTKGNTAADEDAYNLIMKDKEKLLSFDTKLRFIFSHSALKEGWDNPNVFQICTLNETKSESKKRQEIGRGLRLAVNQDGERVYGFNVNTLTVMANESYEKFAESLQKEYEEDGTLKFGIVEKHTFANIVIRKDGENKYLEQQGSEKIWNHLKNESYIDAKGKVTNELKTALKEETFELPEEFNDIKQQVIKDSPNSTQIQEIIINVTNNYGVELSKEANDRVLSLMEDVNDLDIDYKDIKETIKNIGSSISESLKEAGIKLRDSGILEKIGDWFSNVFKSIGEWFKGLFEKSDEVNNEDLETIIPGDESQELDIKEDSDIKHDIFDVSDLENIDEVEEDTNEVDAIEKETISEDLNSVDGEEISESENENTEADNDSEGD